MIVGDVVIFTGKTVAYTDQTRRPPFDAQVTALAVIVANGSKGTIVDLVGNSAIVRFDTYGYVGVDAVDLKAAV